MDPIKVVIFVAVFAALLLLGRKLSSHGSGDAFPGPSMLPESYGAEDDDPVDEEEVESQPAVVGAELPFPISLPPITRSADGFYNRPEILNYYFSKIDLIQGPADPKAFCDEFFIELRSPADRNTWAPKYLVATPAGLQKELASLATSAIHLDSSAIIIAKWDMATVLQEVLKDVMGNWAHSDADESAEDMD